MSKKKEPTTSEEIMEHVLTKRTRMTDDELRNRMALQGKTPEQIESTIRNRNEPHDVKFRRLVNPRLQRAKKAILGLKALANRSAYSYTEAQVVEILKRLNEAIAVVKSAFGGQAENGFEAPI